MLLLLVMKAFPVEHPCSKRPVHFRLLPGLEHGIRPRQGGKRGIRKACQEKKPGVYAARRREVNDAHPLRVGIAGSLVRNRSLPHKLIEQEKILPGVRNPEIELAVRKGKLPQKREELVETLPCSFIFLHKQRGTLGNPEFRENHPEVGSHGGKAFSAEF